jgi:membrane protein DedA with SNARE-associated domain
MAIESACIPLPSEIIMPFAGYLVYRGEMTLHGAALAGAIGCVVGSIPAYYLGLYGGRPIIEKYGKYVLLSRRELDLADRLFQRHGQWVVFGARLLPVVRTFIAFPAGVSKMPMGKFIVYTFAGSYPWCLALAWVGAWAGEAWHTDPRVKAIYHRFELVIVVAGVAAVAWFVWHKVREARRARAAGVAPADAADEA